MLWTDRVFLTTADLARVDSGLASVSGSEGITLDGVGNTIYAGIEEAASELTKLMVAFGGYLNSGDLTANHYAAVMNVGIGNSVRQKATLGQVCVTGDGAASWTPIKQWVALWCAYVIYRNAKQRTVTDRYKEKMLDIKGEIDRRAKPTVCALGVPIVLQPLHAPAATWQTASGTWDVSNVSVVAGSGTLSKSWDVVVTYCDASEANRYVDADHVNNSESAPSPVATVTTTVGHVLSADISTLDPPTGVQPPWEVLVCVVSPRRATHWNLWVGLSGGPLYLQNQQPTPIGVTSLTLAGDPTLSGHVVGTGQYPDRRLSITNTRQRA